MQQLPYTAVHSTGLSMCLSPLHRVLVFVLFSILCISEASPDIHTQVQNKTTTTKNFDFEGQLSFSLNGKYSFSIVKNNNRQAHLIL